MPPARDVPQRSLEMALHRGIVTRRVRRPARTMGFDDRDRLRQPGEVYWSPTSGCRWSHGAPPLARGGAPRGSFVPSLFWSRQPDGIYRVPRPVVGPGRVEMIVRVSLGTSSSRRRRAHRVRRLERRHGWDLSRAGRCLQQEQDEALGSFVGRFSPREADSSSPTLAYPLF